MKKSRLFLFILLLSCLCLLSAAHAAQEVPSGIMEMVIPYTSNEGYWLQTYDEMSTGKWAAAALQGQDGHNLLMLFQKKNDVWTLYAKSDSAIFRGRKQVGAAFVENPITFETDPNHADFTVNMPCLMIWQANADRDDESEYYERTLFFTLRDGKWLLVAWEDFDFCAAYITDDAMYYYGSWLAENLPWYGRVNGTIQRDIRWTGVNLIPHSYDKALKTVTAAPTLPHGDLSAQEVQFTGGKKYEVLSAPDKGSLRAGNGKAAVSTNGWIQVFGREDDWLLIQYSIDSSHYRFGYIPAKALPKNTTMKTLSFTPSTAYLAADTAVTDDPLYSQATLAMLPGGAPVSMLATLGDWAYIESSTSDLLRGFVPQATLTFARTYNLSKHPNNAGTVIFRGQLVVHPGTFSVELSPALYDVSPRSPMTGCQVYDTISGALLLTTSETDQTGAIVGLAPLPSSTTSLRIVPTFADGSIGSQEQSVIVAW